MEFETTSNSHALNNRSRIHVSYTPLSKPYGCILLCPRLVSRVTSLLSFTATMHHPSHLLSTRKAMRARNTLTFAIITLESAFLMAKSRSYMSPQKTTSPIYLPSCFNVSHIKSSLEHSKWISTRSSSSGGVLKKTSRDHIVYVYALFTRPLTPFNLSFYFRYLLFFMITLPVFVQATVFVHLNTKLYFSSPQLSLHFVSDSEFCAFTSSQTDKELRVGYRVSTVQELVGWMKRVIHVAR